LLLKTGQTPISTVVRRLLTGYAQKFNRRHRRYSYLFCVRKTPIFQS